MHSVNRSTVTEFFEILGGEITLVATKFYAFGAGMPTYALYPARMVTLPSGLIKIENMNIVLSSLNILVGEGTNHVLYIYNNIINLPSGITQIKINRRK